MIRSLVPLALGAALACGVGCKRGPDKGPGDGSGVGTPITGPCAELDDRVRDLYKSEKTGNAELDADLLDANVHMVLSDCSAAPERFAPCISRAATVAELERDCLIPLDDEGTVEGRRFAQ